MFHAEIQWSLLGCTTMSLRWPQSPAPHPGVPRAAPQSGHGLHRHGAGARCHAGARRAGSPRSSPDAEEGSGFVHLDITHGAVLVRLQVANDAGFADCGERPRVSGRTDGQGDQSPCANPAKHPAPPHRLRTRTPARPPQSGPIPDPTAPCSKNARCRMGLGTALSTGGSRWGTATLPGTRGAAWPQLGVQDTHRSADTPRWWWRL